MSGSCWVIHAAIVLAQPLPDLREPGLDLLPRNGTISTAGINKGAEQAHD